VETTRLWLAKQHGADADVVRLFALLHDVERWDEGSDPEHGRRGAVLAGRLRGEAFLLDDARFALLEYAIAFHADGKRSDDLTLGACWDADRLDLPRVGIWPNPDLLCTGAAKELLGRMESARPGARPRRKL
jgi:uncharacterized protein